MSSIIIPRSGPPAIGSVRGFRTPGYKSPGVRGGRPRRPKFSRYVLACAKEEQGSAGDIVEVDGMLGIKAVAAKQWITGYKSNFAWEGIYAGDPVPISASNPAASFDWSVKGIPWAQAVAHAKVAIVQQWSRQQPAGSSIPNNSLWAQNNYSTSIWVHGNGGFPARHFEAAWIGFIPGDFPRDKNGLRERPSFLRDGDAPGNRVQIPHMGVDGKQFLLKYVYYGPVTENEAGELVGDLTWKSLEGSFGLGTTAARNCKGGWVNGWGGSNREHPIVLFEQPMDVWQEISCNWAPEGSGFPEAYVVSRDDYNYPWAAGHEMCWAGGDPSLPFGFRFPLSLGARGLPHLDAKSKGWIVWGVQSFPGFAISEHPGSTGESKANEYPWKRVSELQMHSVLPGTVDIGEHLHGAVLLDRH